ncbi:MAG: head GIN domain-containing protein [Leeuwenhoekiella sp.]
MKRLLVLSSLLLVISCQAQWGKTVKGNGDMTTETREVNDYESIHVAGSLNVVLTEGTEGTISVRADENLQEYIIVETKGNSLSIKVEDGYNLKSSSGNKLLITVPVEAIEAVNLAGSGDVVGKFLIRADSFSTAAAGSGDIKLELEAQKIKSSVAGSGNLTLSGSCRDFKVSVAGSGNIDARSLVVSGEIKGSVAGSGDIELNCDNCTLKASISGSGDITYSGNAAGTSTSVVGSGSLTKR